MKGCHFLLQGIFTTQDWTLVSYTADRFFTTEPQGKPLTNTYLRPMHVDVWRKPSQNCKVIALQFKTKDDQQANKLEKVNNKNIWFQEE